MSKAPWETYSASLDEKLSPELEAAIAEYAKNRHDSSSSENEEELHRQREFSAGVAKEYQWVTPDEYADEESRKGRILHSSQFISTLIRNGIKCWYRPHPQPKKITLMVQKDGFGMLKPEIGCWVQFGFMPELSIMKFDDHGVPLDEKYRGWRTCLLQLILKGIITEKKANEIFGRPKVTEQFHRYNFTLKSFRNQGNRLEE